MEGRPLVVVDSSKELFRQSYPRGLLVFFYSLAWLIGLLAGYLLINRLFNLTTTLLPTLLAATWSTALAGALGGTTAGLTRLYQHVSIKQDFQRQSLLLYLVQPITGLIVGILSLYLITIPGAIILNFATALDTFLQNLSLATILSGLVTLAATAVANLETVAVTSTFIAIQILIAWLAGFYQQAGFEKIRSVRRLVAKPEAEITPLAPAQLDENAPLFFKLWLQQRRQMVRWSFTWGIFLILYGLAWLIGLFLIYLLTRPWLAVLTAAGHATLDLILAAWPVAIAGCCGGVFSLLTDLYQHVSVKQDFHRQHLMSYLVQPVIGFIFGLVMYLFVASGYLALRSLYNEANLPPVVDAPTLIMIQLVLGWIAGFRQQTITDLIQRLVEGLIALFKATAAFLNPANLFNQARRQEKAAEIEDNLGVFETLNDRDQSSANHQ